MKKLARAAIALVLILGTTLLVLSVLTKPVLAEGRVDGVGYHNPTTYTTVQDNNHIAIQIKEGEFLFWEILERTSGDRFTGSKNGVRVMYDRAQGRIVVINERTGTEFYNYRS
ncbi:hypothetical protein PN499_08680 [Kamptonema animale CS-326]|jgi:hypothetical protein|uniref:hypothetical protein n=1 Tax=Kamptonema animale TaxID=92934 RepID=UPI00232F8132|nr:hypothetical protein [Kamptonema animale]MDB9511251.1 hypothetical protein [Kamptonema animale CS-326]